jgi:glycosyltransferase involved in cell wall biosynthesis
MVIPSWYSSSRNKVHGSFFKEQFKALSNNDEKITVAYNEVWPITMLGKIGEKRGLNFNIEDNLRTYRYKDYNYFPKMPLMFKSFNKRMDILYQEIIKYEGKVDIIHAHSAFWGAIAAAYLSKKYNIPLVITEHSSLKYAKYVRESYKKYIFDAYKKADYLIAVGNGLKKEMQEYVNKPIEVIHNMVELSLFNVNKNGRQYIHEDKEFEFFSCALDISEEGKGMECLIKAFAKAFKDQNVSLRIGGDDSLKLSLNKLIQDLNMDNQIKLLGALSREEVSKEMKRCDAFTLASEHETFGVVYIEALACGKPVIGTDNGGAEDIINEDNGIIAKKKNVGDLAKALVQIKENYEMYDKDKIREKTIFSYSEKVLVEKLKGVYKKVYEGNN